MIYKSYNPIDYEFKWTNDGWYEWDSKVAHQRAKKDRDEEYKELKRRGFKIKRSVLKNQIITRGGIGTGRPEVSFVVDVYKISETIG